MPHYYFHTTGALAHNDDEGVELSDGHAAREQALASAGELLKEVAATKRDNFELAVDVTDSDQRRIYTVRVVAGAS